MIAVQGCANTADICRLCGWSLHIHDNFCGQCGAEIELAKRARMRMVELFLEREDLRREKEKNAFTLTSIASIILSMIALVITLVFMTKEFNSSQSVMSMGKILLYCAPSMIVWLLVTWLSYTISSRRINRLYPRLPFPPKV